MTLALVDLDDLKWVNDTHGHAAGDAAIGVISKSLRATFRATDVLARIGGDEFAVILADVGETIAAKVAERFLHELWTHNLPVDDGVIRVSASVGIAGVHSADGPRSWVDRADRRLYRAKGLGKNRVVTEISVDARS
jgi:diguanylate cyclase